MAGTSGAVLTGAAATLATCAIVVFAYELGPQTHHMALHILSMNVIAPVLAALIAVRRKPLTMRVSLFWLATVLQIVLLWGWHAPAIYNVVADVRGLQLPLHIVLLLAALLFWSSLLTLSGARRWQAIPALLISGKLVCLLAALIVFAPRTLYGDGHAAHLAAQLTTWSALDDQHLAGLLMIAACPLSYLVPAVLITIQLIKPRAHADATA